MRISDWSSDVCSSDLIFAALQECWRALRIFMARFLSGCVAVPICDSRPPLLWGELIIILRSLQETRIFTMLTTSADRKSVVSGKSVSVRVDLGGRRIIKKKKKHK